MYLIVDDDDRFENCVISPVSGFFFLILFSFKCFFFIIVTFFSRNRPPLQGREKVNYPLVAYVQKSLLSFDSILINFNCFFLSFSFFSKKKKTIDIFRFPNNPNRSRCVMTYQHHVVYSPVTKLVRNQPAGTTSK